ncbi:RraA family protein [Sabulicella rubraurantiaca]|uniref:RraA family protein n=1 Tax=Sabulicella rubraurantiaca TaxID=2811429 RepID=UPI001A96AFD6|nr:RraA family protein [Sabulicella rubraurantiaca]
MLHDPPLLTIHRGHRRPDKALVEAFRGAQTSHLCDAMDGRGALDYRIKPLDPGNAAFAGPAITGWTSPADVVGMFGTLAEAEPGDVLVVACDAFTGTAVLGDLAAGMMRNKGCAAFVTDGLARDRAGILETGLPVFAAGISPNSPARKGLGVVGLPVNLGGVQVRPGDILVGDADGVVVVPLDRAEAVLEALGQVHTAEEKAVRRVAEGAVMSPAMEPILAAARVIG